MAGRKTFTAGEVLQAADVNDFLMDQSVMVFAGTAARGSAIPSPTEGMVTYLSDSDEVQVYDGSAFVPVAPTDSGLIQISTTTFSSVASVSLDNVFSATYNSYRVFFNFTNTAAATLRMRFRTSGSDNSTSSYSTQTLRASATSVTASRPQFNGDIADLLGNEGVPAIGVKDYFLMNIEFPFATNRTNFHSVYIQDGNFMLQTGGGFTGTTSFDGFSIIPASGSITGSITVQGYKE